MRNSPRKRLHSQGTFETEHSRSIGSSSSHLHLYIWRKYYCKSLGELVPPTSESRKRLMSPFPASMATATNQFLLSLNALLVVSGFCHVFTKYCQDGFLLGLQAVARENKLGPIWCGASGKFISGCTSGNNTDFF